MRFGQVISVRKSKGIQPFRTLLGKKKNNHGRRKKSVLGKLKAFFSF